MTYSNIFRNSGVELAFQQISRDLAGAGKSFSDFLASSTSSIGKSLESIGETLISVGNPTARHYGEAIKAAGQLIDKGPNAWDAASKGALFEWAAKEAIADVISGGLTAAAGFGVLAALAGVLGATPIGAAATLGVIASTFPVPFFIGLAAFVFATKVIGDGFADDIYKSIQSSLKKIIDPIILDLDGDGITLAALGSQGEDGASTVHFDYDNDGFAERTGWVGPDDGMLALDINGNGKIDNGAELFGTPTRDGYEVLETYDSYRDGIIDAKDAIFADLKIWRDLNSDGVTDAGELQSLAEAGITSISLNRQDVQGTNAGHDRGFQGSFTRTDGSIGTAETIYFQTDRQQTRADNTPNFTPAAGVEKLPQLPGSGTINSIAWKATHDASFRAAWTALADDAVAASRSELLTRFETVLLQWAGVDQIEVGSRGAHVDARHLAFVEAFFGQDYREVVPSGSSFSNSPSTVNGGRAIEGNFQGIVELALTIFLAQSVPSFLQRGGALETALASPYLAYSMLDFRTELAEGEQASPTPGNLGAVIGLIKASAPSAFGASVSWFDKALSGLPALTGIAFAGSSAEYRAFVEPLFADITDPVLKQIAINFAKGSAFHGRARTEGVAGDQSDNVLVGGAGDDVLAGREGSDIYIYSKTDGSDWISDSDTGATDLDTLVLTDLNRQDIALLRVGDALIVKILSTGKKITIEGQFRTSNAGLDAGEGIEAIRFSDGSTVARDVLLHEAVLDGSSLPGIFGGSVTGTTGDDVLRGGRGSDHVSVSGTGNDIVIYAKGDGNDVISRTTTSGKATLQLVDLSPDDVTIYRDGAGNLIIKVKETGEFITDEWFFWTPSQALGISEIKFASGVTWSRAQIIDHVEILGTDSSETLFGSSLADRIRGGAGADSILHLSAGDIAFWKPGDGNDTVSANASTGVTTLKLENTLMGDVLFSHRGGDLLITHKATGEVITVPFFVWTQTDLTDYSPQQNTIGIISFADGTNLNQQAIANKIGSDFGGIKFATTLVTMEGVVLYHYYQDEFGNLTYIDGTPPVGYYRVDQSPDIQVTPDYNGTDGPDILRGDSQDNSISGGAGDDTLFGYKAAASNSGNDTLEGQGGNDLLYGGDGNDTLVGGTGADILDGGDGNDVLDGGAHHDVLKGGFGDDIYDGGAGDDTLSETSGSGSDTYIWGAGRGNDIILESGGQASGVDSVVFANGASADDFEFVRVGSNLVIVAISSGETLTVSNQFDSSGPRIESFGSLSAAEVAQRIVYRGTGLADVQNGSELNETFDLGKGDDRAYGKAGNDRYVYRKGDGNELIVENSGEGDQDKIVFLDVNITDVEFERQGSHLVVKVIETSQLIFVRDHFYGVAGAGIEQIEFANGTMFSRAQIAEAAWVRGTPGLDALNVHSLGTGTTIFAGQGNDSIVGSMLGETYIYRRGDGTDAINESGNNEGAVDVLKLTNLLQGDVRLGLLDSSGLSVGFVGSLDTISIASQFSGAAYGVNAWSGIESISFADGSSWSRSDILYWATAGAQFYGGTIGNDTIQGSYLDQRLEGGRGDDTIDGGLGADQIFGGLGNDTLVVSAFDSGHVDQLDGGGGIDTARFSDLDRAVRVDLVVSDGIATVDDIDPITGNPFEIATLRLIENIEGTQFGDTILGAGEANRLMGDGGDDLLDGRSGADTLVGGSGSDSLIGGAGDDTLEGGIGADAYRYYRGDGSDLISDQLGYSGDWIEFFQILPSQAALSRHGDDLIVEIADGGSGNDDDGMIRVKNYFQLGSSSQLDRIMFGNGTVWSAADIADRLLPESGLPMANILGSAGVDTLQGTSAADVIRGGLGDDLLKGATGSDIYIYRSSDGSDRIDDESSSNADVDILKLVDLNPSDLLLLRDGNHLKISVLASGKIITIDDQFLSQSQNWGIDRIEFASGDVWDRAAIRANTWLYGTSGNDNIQGSTEDDRIAGLTGDDVISDAGGSDTYTYASGEGSDRIVDSSTVSGETDRLRLTDLNPADVTFSRTATDLLIKVNATGHVITVTGQFVAPKGVELLEFANGSVWTRANIDTNVTTFANALNGTPGNDSITGTSGADVIYGAAGNDVLKGLGGSDSYFYNFGDGDDRIEEGYGSGEIDKIVFGSGLNASNAILTRSNTNGADLTVSFVGVAGSVLIKDGAYSLNGYGVEQFVFGDGTTWNLTDMRAAYLAQAKTSGNDTIYGFTGVADTISGGAGNDILRGLEGSDTYLYNLGDGDDRIEEAYGSGDTDKIVFGSGLNAANATLTRSNTNGSDLTIGFAGVAGSVLIKDGASSANGYGVEQFVFGDGTTWSLADIRTAYLTRAKTSGNDTIYGFTGVADTLSGGAGNDTLRGLEGSDTYLYNLGDGNDQVVEGYGAGETDKIVFGAGLNVADVILTRSGTNAIDLTISFAGVSGSVWIDDAFHGSYGYGVEQVEFADSTVWTLANLRAAYLAQAQTSGNDTVYGFTGVADTLSGGEGNDILRGLEGSDTYLYNLGDGDDRIEEAYGSGDTDKITFGAGLDKADIIVTRSISDVDDVTISFNGIAGSVLVDEAFYASSGYGVEQYIFNDGTVWGISDLLQRAWFRGTSSNETINGTSADDRIDAGGGNDTLSASGGNDTLIGGSGNDTLTGGAGNDVFVFGAGFGKDVITDFVAGAASADVIEFDDAVFADLSSVLAAASQVGADTLITYDVNNTITLKNVTMSNLHQDDFRFV